MTANDLDLLVEFTRDQSQDAFTALVQRHLDLVFCAALRQVRSPQLAEEVAQSVFTDLARNAARLKSDTILTAWLYEVTRRTAINLVRGEARRQFREQIATEMNAMNATAADWTHIEPLLDEAMHALDDTDRTAVLLRYFENKSLREVGATLGTSDDAAQKRVSRAIERLREFFAKRGVTIGGTGLALLISAQAVQAAPIGLAVTISTAAALVGTTLATTATTTAIKTIAITTLQKTFITATIVAAVGTGIYEARRAFHLHNEVQTLRQQQVPLAEQIQQLTKDRDEATRQFAALRDDNKRLNRNTPELLRLRGEVGRLRKQAEKESPPKGETTSATTSIQAPSNQAEFEALKNQMMVALGRIEFALRQYMTNSPLGVIIDNSGQLNPNVFSNSAALPLNRFQILVRDVQHLASATEQNPKLVIAKSAAPIPFDGNYTYFYLLADGSVTATTLGVGDEPTRNGFLIPDKELRALAEAQDPIRKALLPALEAFAAANNGQRPADLSQLQPYITTPQQQTVLQTEIERVNLRNAAGKSRTYFQFAPRYYEPSPIEETEQRNSIGKP